MQAIIGRRSGVWRAAFSCFALLILGAASTAEAQSRRNRETSPFQVALQPFSVVRNAVHAVAEPIAERVPRTVARVASAPSRIAGTTSRVVSHDYDDDEEAGESVYSARPVRMAEPVQVAYVTHQPVRRAEPIPSRNWDDEQDDFADHEAPRNEQSFDDGNENDEETEQAPPTEWSGDRPTVSGSRAVLRNGIAYAPSRAPENVKNAIWAANALRRKPYIWGGGHRSFHDRGYDCSGAVSYALHYAGVLASPMPSTGFLNYGRRGRGRWITIYSRRGHTFAVIAGLRLDTTDFQRGGNSGPRWHVDGRDTGDFVARHPAGL